MLFELLNFILPLSLIYYQFHKTIAVKPPEYLKPALKKCSFNFFLFKIYFIKVSDSILEYDRNSLASVSDDTITISLDNEWIICPIVYSEERQFMTSTEKSYFSIGLSLPWYSTVKKLYKTIRVV